MADDLSGCVAMVVGSGSGIGRATAEAFGKRGARVILVNRNPETGLAAAEGVRKAGGEALFFQADATSPDGTRDMVAYALKEWGRLDMAVNNVGGSVTHAGLAETSVEEFDESYRFNTRSCFLAMKHQLVAMREQGKGAIVNVASLAGLIGSPGLSAYVSAKHGVIGLTRTAALEYATRNIRVNAICPGATETERLQKLLMDFRAEERGLLQHWVEPMGRFGFPYEQAEAAVWLCSDAASFVTGHALPIDGGHMAGNRLTEEDDA